MKHLKLVDPKTGCSIEGPVTTEQENAYLKQSGHPAFWKACRVGEYLIDEDTGPGMWFGGAGF